MSDDRRSILGSILVIDRAPDGDGSEDLCLKRIARDVLVAADVATAGEHVRARPLDLIVVREDADVSPVLCTLRAARARFPGVPSVVVTAKPSVESAVKCAREGAHDYIEAPLAGYRLQRLLAVAAGEGDVREQAEECLWPSCSPGAEMVGRSAGMMAALEKIHIVAESNCNPVLILGETGTGKELAAKAVHLLRHQGGGDGRKDRFVAVNCAALTTNLFESELFGHVKGAFTGADRDRAGLFEAAE
ncbi:hypothetical protein LCGC14_2339100, partial [marine sediment metagenome]